MIIQNVRHFDQDLDKRVDLRQGGSVSNADNEGVVVTVSLYHGDEAAVVEGVVYGAVVCPDGSTVPLQGSKDGNEVTVALNADSVAIPGMIGLGIQVINDTIKTTVFRCVFTVEVGETSTPVDPGSRITMSVADLIQDINDALANIPASDTNLKAAMALVFSTSTAYQAGQYVWYEGQLYKFTADHAAGTWTGTDAGLAALATDVYDIKTELDQTPYMPIYGFTVNNGIVLGATVGEQYTTQSANIWRSTKVPARVGVKYKCVYSLPNDNYTRAYVIFCDDNNIVKGNYVASYGGYGTDVQIMTCPAGATHLIVNAYVRRGNYQIEIGQAYIGYEYDIDDRFNETNDRFFTQATITNVRKELAIGITIDTEYTVTESNNWRSAKMVCTAGEEYKCSFTTPNDDYYRSYVIFCDDNNIIKGFYANSYAAKKTETVVLQCPIGATHIIVNARVNSSAYTIEVYRPVVDEVHDVDAKLNDFENEVRYGPSNGTIKRGEIILPPVITVASGRQCNLYWSTIANIADGDKSVYFETKCDDIGKNTERGFVIDADNSAVGSHTIKIVCKDTYSRNILSTYDGTINIVAPLSVSGTKNVLMMGDSRTWQRSNGVQGTSTNSDAGKTITAETKALLSDSFPGVFNFIGTEVSPFDSSVKNLAVSGWKITNAMTTIENAGGIVSYVETSCGLGTGASLDVVTIMYGVNDLANWRANNLNQYDVSIAKIHGFITNLKTLISTITTGYPSAKIIIIIEPTTCANQDGFGYFGENTDRDAHIELEQAMKVLRKTLIAEITAEAYSNVVISSAGVWCDRLYNFPYIDEKPSARTSVKIVPRYVNCVHPHDDGYKQIADGIYSTIVGLYQ